MQIKLVRHAPSYFNVGLIKHEDMPNHKISIVEKEGAELAMEAGSKIGRDFIQNALLYQSPYLRTRQTMKHLLIGAGIPESQFPKIYEDPRLREVDFGYGDPEKQKEKRNEQGYFWYRMDGGESAADCFDRCATFLDSMMRQLKRKTGINGSSKDVLIVTHSLVIRCFVMRFLHLSVEEFDTIASPNNCDIITIGLSSEVDNPQFKSGKWAVSGLRMR